MREFKEYVYDRFKKENFISLTMFTYFLNINGVRYEKRRREQVV